MCFFLIQFKSRLQEKEIHCGTRGAQEDVKTLLG